MRTLALCGSLILAAVAPAQAGVVISEIMYHPVEKPAFDPSGDPLFDLTDDVHEFIEIHNPDGAAVALDGWKLTGGLDYTFPQGVSIAPGQFLVIAKNPARIAAVYGLAQTQVWGPWSGGLKNSEDTVRLENTGGTVVDGISYSAAPPWPGAADELGADDEWTGLSSASYQYKGRSLQRVSSGWPTNDPANWLASPLSPGPSPGAPNAVSLAVPAPVVLRQRAVQDDTNAAIIRANQTVRIDASFSAAAAGISNVAVEYFKDDINLTNETIALVPMAEVPGKAGSFSCHLPGQVNRSVIRYRVRAERGAGVEIVSPRADDPFPWHGYFVTPVRTSVNPIYDVFISTLSLNTLNTNISQSPKRITNPDPPGTPRVSWNATAPAVFIGPDAVVRDIRVRYHGSRYNRRADRRSFKYQFPRYARFEDHESYFITDKGEEHRVGSQLYEAAGLPVWRCRYIDLYQNGSAKLQRLQQEEMDDVLHRRWAAAQAAKFPGTPTEEMGEFYKSTGVVPSEVGEGPYGVGTCQKLAPKLPYWTPRQRYEWTFGIQMHSWLGGRDFEQMINGLWGARGDTHTSPNPNLTNLRTWLAEHFDVDATLTYIAIRNWSSPFDNATHNYFVWRRYNGRWAMLPWDLDSEFGDASKSVFWDEQTNPQPDTLRGPQWIKDSFIKAFRAEYRQKLWILNNSLLLASTFPARGWSSLQAFANSRNTSVNAQLGFGTFHRPQTPAVVAPADGTPVSPGASLQTSTYAHGAPATPPAHASTTWLIRASGGTYDAPILRLASTADLTVLPIPFDLLVFGQTYFWKCFYLDIAGHPSFESTERSFVFGTATSVPTGTVRLNEILAHGGNAPDFIELHNTTGAAVELSGMGLTDDPAAGAKFIFPPGAAIAGNGYHLMTLGMGAPFHLDRDGQTVVLLTAAGNLADSVTFGPQPRDLSLGRGIANWEIGVPTPDAVNQPLATGSAAGLRLNEWMASEADGPDWFEIHNTGPTPVALGGLILGNGITSTTIPALSFLAAHGFQRFVADKDPAAGANHVNFKLSSSGETITLTDAANTTIDTVAFGPQTTDVSEGRLADGTASIVPFPGSATPGESNAQAITELVINALVPDVWLLNSTTSPVVIDGWWLSDSIDDLHKYQIPVGGGLIPARGELVIDDDELPFQLNEVRGGTLYLSHSGTHRLSQDFGVYDGHPHGRIATTMGVDFARLTTPSSPHVPQLGPIALSEINYHPPDLPGDDDDYEFVELLNISGAAVNLGGWKLTGNVEFVFPGDTQLAAGQRVCVAGLAAGVFSALYDLPAGAMILGPYSGKLDNGGGTVELLQPLPPVTTPGPDFGLVPEVTIERVNFGDIVPWPVEPDGAGPALVRGGPMAYANDPAHWTTGMPSPGAAPSANQRPTVTLASPGSNSQIPIGETVTLTAVASDADGTVKLVEFLVDGQTVGQSTSASFTFNWTAAEPGPHLVVARALDGRLAWGESATVEVFVINQPPTVLLTLPPAGSTYTYPASIPLAATANDADGGVVRVEFFANGSKIGEDLNGAPWTFTWTAASRGPYALTARAVDAYDAATQSVAVGVSVARSTILAYSVPAGTVGTQSFANGLGMDFDVLHPIIVTKLGVFDSGGNGLAATLTVQLIRRAPTVAVLATQSFTASVPGMIEVGTASRLKPLAAALALSPGQYCIVSYGHTTTDLNDNAGTRGNKPWTSDDGEGLLAFVGGGRYGGNPGGLPPSVDGGPADRYAAGTFEYTTIDADADALPYDWEIANGLDPANPADAARDNDGDAQSNRSEYLAGSNPNDSTSVLRIDLVDHSPGSVTLRFPVFPNRTTTVQSSIDLAIWTALQTITPAANPRTLDVTDSAPGSRARYYRVTATP